VDDVDFDPGAGDPTLLLASVSGFNVPAAGGAITAHANITAEPVPLGVSQLALAWIVIDGDGTCPNPVADPAGTGFLYVEAPLIITTTSAMTTLEVPAGATRVDLCVGALGTEATNLSGRLNVTWVPEVSGAGVASSNAKTWQEILAPYADALGG
jgi:hypothetical protein